MASEEFQQLLKSLPGSIAVPGDSVDEVRTKFDAAHGQDPGNDVRVTHAEYGGTPGEWVVPDACADSERVVFFLHGGAFVSVRAPEFTFYAAWVARHAQARAFVVDYPLAPEARFPAQLDASVAAFRGMVEQGIEPARVAFVGDSCGGGLVVTTMLRLRDAGLALPACGVSLSGWMDLEASGESATHPVGEDPFMDAQWLRERGRDYLGPDQDPRQPYASPIHADLAGLPPLLLQYGQIDRCRDDGTRLAARAGRDGVAVTLEIWPEMIHGFQGLYGAVPEATWAFRHLGAFVDRHLP
jgi:acetyl esterase/lipase